MPGEVGGEIERGELISSDKFLVQSSPTNELYCIGVKFKLVGEQTFNVARFKLLPGGRAELNDATEFVALNVLGVGQQKLCVVLDCHD